MSPLHQPQRERPSPQKPQPVWTSWGPLATLALIFSVTAAILFIAFVGLLIFGALGALSDSSSSEVQPLLPAYLFLLLYFGALIAACVAFARKQRLAPLFLLLAFSIALLTISIFYP